jgi:hypothetical protein
MAAAGMEREQILQTALLELLTLVAEVVAAAEQFQATPQAAQAAQALSLSSTKSYQKPKQQPLFSSSMPQVNG